MSVRAGIVITGTEVLTGIIADRNGPWLADRLRERGVELTHTTIVADRPVDLLAALRFLAETGVDLIITSGGLGPTADDLTAEVVAEFSGRPLVLDVELEARIAAILDRLTARWPDLDREGIRHGNRKQATIPEGATPLAPVGTAPGLVVPPAEGRALPTVLVLPGPPGELQPMWVEAMSTEAVRSALSGARELRRRIIRMFGIPESELAQALRDFEAAGLDVAGLEITTCLRAGEIEVATTFDPEAASERYAALETALADRFPRFLYARDGETVDELVAALLSDGPRTIATAESCTGGLLAARLTERPGSSAYVLGGVVAYSNEAKVEQVGVDPALISSFGAVSPEVARALADGARARFGASIGVGITGIAGPDGGTPEKPVGTVCVSVAAADARLEHTLHLPGSRTNVRDRATVTAMHLIRHLAEGERD